MKKPSIALIVTGALASLVHQPIGSDRRLLRTPAEATQLLSVRPWRVTS